MNRRQEKLLEINLQERDDKSGSGTASRTGLRTRPNTTLISSTRAAVIAPKIAIRTTETMSSNQYLRA